MATDELIEENRFAEVDRDGGRDVLDDLRAVLGVVDEPQPQPVAVVDVLLSERLGGPQRRAIDQAQGPATALLGFQCREAQFPQSDVDDFRSGSTITETGALASSRTPICTPSPAMMPITADCGDATASVPDCGASATAVILHPCRRIVGPCVSCSLFGIVTSRPNC